MEISPGRGIRRIILCYFVLHLKCSFYFLGCFVADSYFSLLFNFRFSMWNIGCPLELPGILTTFHRVFLSVSSVFFSFSFAFPKLTFFLVISFLNVSCSFDLSTTSLKSWRIKKKIVKKGAQQNRPMMNKRNEKKGFEFLFVLFFFVCSFLTALLNDIFPVHFALFLVYIYMIATVFSWFR